MGRTPGYQEYIPVAALDPRPALGRSAVAGLMTDLVAVAALDDLAVLRHMIGLATLVACTRLTRLLALLSAVTNTMTLLTTQHAANLDTVNLDLVLGALTHHVTHLATANFR